MADNRFPGIQRGAGSSPSPAANPQVKRMIGVSDPTGTDQQARRPEGEHEATVGVHHEDFVSPNRAMCTRYRAQHGRSIVATRTFLEADREAVRMLGRPEPR